MHLLRCPLTHSHTMMFYPKAQLLRTNEVHMSTESGHSHAYGDSAWPRPRVTVSDDVYTHIRGCSHMSAHSHAVFLLLVSWEGVWIPCGLEHFLKHFIKLVLRFRGKTGTWEERVVTRYRQPLLFISTQPAADALCIRKRTHCSNLSQKDPHPWRKVT